MARSAKQKPDHTAGLALLERIGSRKVMPSRRKWIETFVQCRQKKDTARFDAFKLNLPQRMIDDARQAAEDRGEPFRAAILKARQWGITLLALAWQLEEAIRTPNTQGLIVAPEDDLAREVLGRGKDMIRLLPFQLPTKYDNRSELSFDEPIHSTIKLASAKTKDPGRGRTYRFVHATEPATWPDPEGKVASLMQAVPYNPGTVLCFEGTARGIGNWWHDFWWGAKNGENDYSAFFFPWWMDPDFDYSLPVSDEEARALRSTLDEEEKWLLMNGAELGGIKWRRFHIRNNFPGYPELFRQEFPATPEEAFLSSGNKAFNAAHVLSQRERKRSLAWRGDIALKGWKDSKLQYERIANPKGVFKVWHEPDPSAQYLIGVDTGHGFRDGDFSVACVIDQATSEQVAELTCQFEPHVFSDLVHAVGMLYNRAYVLPEANAAGVATISFLIDRGYPNLGRRPVFDATTRRLEDKWGWHSTQAQKEVIVRQAQEVLATAFEQAKAEPCAALVHSEELIDELFEYEVEIDDAGKASYAAPGKRHDDHVCAWMIALIARRDVLQREVEVEERVRRKTLHELLWEDVRPEDFAKEEADTWEAIV